MPRALLTACRAALDLRGSWRPPPGHPGSLALCVVEAVHAPRLPVATTAAVVERYRAHRTREGGDADADDVAELLATFDALGGDEGWAAAIGTRHRAWAHAGAPLRAEAVRRAAEALRGARILTTVDLHGWAAGALAADEPDVAAGEGEAPDPVAAWRSVPGQASGLSWHWLVAQSRWQGAVPDAVVRRFVARALGLPSRSVGCGAAARLLDAAAVEVGVPARELDHAVWRAEGSRRAGADVPGQGATA